MAEVERIEPDQIEVFDNKIAEYLYMFCEENDIKDLKTESQNVWNGALMYIRRYVFPDKSILKSNKRNTVDGNNIQSNYNAYDYEIVNSICDYYIYICSMYDKEISINGFSYLTGIDGTINTSANRQRAVKAPSSKGKDKALSRLKCTVQVRRESFFHLTR